MLLQRNATVHNSDVNCSKLVAVTKSCNDIKMLVMCKVAP